jgi:phosphoglycolate phosphatase-like HAD superfamily hydrolase
MPISFPSADAYVFDIDGTLLVTRDLVHWNALHQAMLEAYGVDTTIEGIPYHGMTDLSILRATLARVGIQDGAFESALPKALDVGWHKIEAAGLRKHFRFGYYSDRCETRAGIFRNAVDRVKRELGATAKTCFVGDTPADVRAAREIGAQIVAVASGTFGIDQLKACGPDLCVAQCEELLG